MFQHNFYLNAEQILREGYTKNNIKMLYYENTIKNTIVVLKPVEIKTVRTRTFLQ